MASAAPVAPPPRPTHAGLGEVAVRGVVTLGMREGAMKLLAFAGDIALYRLLTPADFGVIVPIAFLAGMVKQFADLGLHPSLIQRKDEPGRDALRAVFTAQLGLVLVAASVVFFAGPAMVAGLLGGAADPWMIRVFALSILLSAFRLVPAALLERHLRFGRLSAADIAGTLWYYGAGIGFAIAAFNVWSLVIAHVGASIAATLLVMAAQPWRPVPSLRVSAIRPYLNFGAQFQGSRLALMLKGRAHPAVRAPGVRRRDHRAAELGRQDRGAAAHVHPTGRAREPAGLLAYSGRSPTGPSGRRAHAQVERPPHAAGVRRGACLRA